MKLLTPQQIHRRYVKETYDIEVSYLEGPCARIISGCPDRDTKLVSWIHSTMTEQAFSASFRSRKETVDCYSKFDLNVGVSEGVLQAFQKVSGITGKGCVLYNTIDSETILRLMKEPAPEIEEDGAVKLAAVGSLKEGKGFERLIAVIGRLKREQRGVHLYILGKGPLREKLGALAEKEGAADRVTFLGYQTNPYKYLAKCDLFVCPSFSEGFSTAAAEALIVGIPVCTTDVSGMRELLGEDGSCGRITENSEDGLFCGLRDLISDADLRESMRAGAAKRGQAFRAEETAAEVERVLKGLVS